MPGGLAVLAAAAPSPLPSAPCSASCSEARRAMAMLATALCGLAAVGLATACRTAVTGAVLHRPTWPAAPGPHR